MISAGAFGHVQRPPSFAWYETPVATAYLAWPLGLSDHPLFAWYEGLVAIVFLARPLGMSDTVHPLLNTRLRERQRTWHVGLGKLLARRSRSLDY